MFETLAISYDGRYITRPVGELDMDPNHPSDEQVKAAARSVLSQEGYADANLSGFVVDPPEADRATGVHNVAVLNLRPTAPHGA